MGLEIDVMRDRWVGLAVAWATLFVVGTDLFVVSPLLPLIAADYGVSPTVAGLAVTAFALSYMVSAPLLGHVADRLGSRKVLICCLATFAVANLLTAWASNVPALLAARMLAGSMAAGVSPLLYALVGEAAPAGRRGTWLSIAVSGLLISLSLGTPIGALAGAWFGWSTIFVVLAGASIVLVWVNYRVWPRGSEVGVRARPAPLDAMLLAHPALVGLGASSGLVLRDRREGIGDLVQDTINDGPGDLGASGRAAEPEQPRTHHRVPGRSAQALQGGNAGHGVVLRPGRVQQGIEFRGGWQQPDSGHPVQRGAGRRDEPLQRVAGLATPAPRAGREHTRRRRWGGWAGLGEDECSGAEGHLRRSRAPTAESEQ